MGFWRNLFGMQDNSKIKLSDLDAGKRSIKSIDITNYPRDKQIYLNKLEMAKRTLLRVHDRIDIHQLRNAINTTERFILRIHDQPNTNAWYDVELFQNYISEISNQIDASVIFINKMSINDKDTIIEQLRQIERMFK